MDKEKTAIHHVEKVLDGDPRTQDSKNGWLFLSAALRSMGYKVWIELKRDMPSPEALLRERREILHKRNKYSEDFVLEPGITIEKPSQSPNKKGEDV